MLGQEAVKLLLTDQAARKWVSQRSFHAFALIYFPHYFELEPAEFHADMFGVLGDWSIQFADITGFRGCAKSSAASTIAPIWAPVTGRSKFTIPVNATTDVSKINFDAIKIELETNEALRLDWGAEIGDRQLQKWSDNNIVLACGARIFARARKQKIRGLRHRQWRPDYIVMDDIEDEDRVDKVEYRDETERWMRGQVIPAAEESKSKVVVVGNQLNSDGIMARLKKNPLFTHRSYPLLDPVDNHCTWRGKYPDQAALDRQAAKVGPVMWQREYLLRVVPKDGQIVKEEWIKRWNEAMLEGAEIFSTETGVDLAISKKATADCTTMVTVKPLKLKTGEVRIVVMPNPVNARLSFRETINTAHALSETTDPQTSFGVEDVAYQKAAIEEMQAEGLAVTGIKITTDKRSRLMTVATLIQQGTVLFPEKGCEDLLIQLLFFGVEGHDDLVDAFVYAVQMARLNISGGGRIMWG